MQSPDKSENAEGISFPRSAATAGHNRPRRRTRDRRFRREPSRLPRLQDCWAFARAFESNGKPLGERGFVERHIFEFRPSRNDAVGDRVYSPRSWTEKGAYGFDIARCRTEIGAARRSSGEDCRRRRRPLRLTRCCSRTSLPAGRRPRRARRRSRAFPRSSWRRCRRRRAGDSGRSLRRGSGSACSATRYARDR